MRTVHKFPVPITDSFTLDIPKSHKVVHLGLQDGEPFMWIEVDTDTDARGFVFHVEGTGHRVAPHTDYVGSLIMPPFVWHVYEDTFRLDEVAS